MDADHLRDLPDTQVIPVMYILVSLATTGLMIALGAEVAPVAKSMVARAHMVFISFCGLALAGWIILAWREGLGRWFAAFATLLALHEIAFILGLSDALALACLPVLTGFLVVGASGAWLLAAVQAGGLILLAILAPSIAPPWLMALSALSGLATAATYSVLTRAHRDAQTWLTRREERAHELIAEVTAQRQEMKQVVENLSVANRQLLAANERIAALRQLAEEAERTKSTFVATVSHEFRTPLNMIVGLVELMRDSPEIYAMVPSPKLQRDLDTIRRNGDHLARMINDVLDLTQAEAGRMLLHRERVDLAELISECLEAVRPLMDRKGLASRMEARPDLPQAYCDRTRVRQVVLNLLSNAARFTEQGEITVSARSRENGIEVCVLDTGPGIAPEDAALVFEPFWQGNRQLWREHGGSGMGLSISRRFVELHGGRIWVESDLGEGAAFHFTLPLSAPLPHLVRPARFLREDWAWREKTFRASSVAADGQDARLNVLVVDEVGSLADRVEGLSSELFFGRCSSVQEAVVRAGHEAVHCVLVNGSTPDRLMRLTTELAAGTPGTPVLGVLFPALAQQALEAGAAGFVSKPVTREQLEQTLRSRPDLHNVMVVDDDPDVCDVVTRLLQAVDPGLDIRSMASGAEALEAMRHLAPQLVLLDIIMPGMDGWRTLSAMAREGLLAQTAVYMLSAQEPYDEPARTDRLTAGIAGGLPLNRVLDCAIVMPRLLIGLPLGRSQEHP